MSECTKPPGWDWEIDYESDGTTETMLVFGQVTIEAAIAEARYSLSANIFRDPEFVAPAILSARRI